MDKGERLECGGVCGGGGEREGLEAGDLGVSDGIVPGGIDVGGKEDGDDDAGVEGWGTEAQHCICPQLATS